MKKIDLKGVSVDGKSYRYRYEVKLALDMVSKRSKVICKTTEPYAVVLEHYNRVLKSVEHENKFQIKDLWDLWRTRPSFKDRKEETIKQEIINAEVLINYFGSKAIDDINLSHVAQFCKKRQEPDNGLTKARKTDSPSQAKKEKGLLSRMFDYGAQLGICHQIDTRRIEIARVKPRTRVIENWEFSELQTNFSEIGELFTIGSYLLCARQKDMRELSENQLEPEGVFIKQSKTGKAQLKEFNSDLKEWLARVLKRYRHIKVRCREKGKPVPSVLLCKNNGQMYTKSGVCEMMKKARKPLEDKHGVSKDGRITFHSYKRTTITNFKKDGRKATKEEKLEMSGHKTRAMLDIYDLEVPKVPSNVLPRDVKDKKIDLEDGVLRDTIVELEKHRIGRGGGI